MKVFVPDRSAIWASSNGLGSSDSLRGQAFRGEGKPSGLATDGLQGFIELEGKLKAFGGHGAVKMEYGLRAVGGEGLSNEVAGTGVEGTVETVGSLGGAELAGGAGGVVTAPSGEPASPKTSSGMWSGAMPGVWSSTTSHLMIYDAPAHSSAM